MSSFQANIELAVSKHGPLCLGIDPSEKELHNWELPDSATGAKEFALRCIEAAEGRIGIVKPQVAFFERFGSSGFLALEEVLQAARDLGLLVISDAKRGDIGSTMLGYAQAWFGDDSPLRVDALTVSPYLGPSSTVEILEHARDIGGGIFLLAATSNPEATELQTAKTGKATVSATVIELAQKIGLGDCGVVIGATQDLDQFGIAHIRTTDVEISILAPGYGAQGAKLSGLKDQFGASSSRVIPNMSRALTMAGPESVAKLIDKAKLEL